MIEWFISRLIYSRYHID